MTGDRSGIRLGIIGCGGMGNHHAKVFGGMPGVELVACCDPKRPKVEGFAERWNITRTFTDYRDLLSLPALDAVTIAVPDALHGPFALEALERVRGVFLEKPMAATAGEAERILRVSGRLGRIGVVNFSKRNAPSLQEAERLIGEGCLGRILTVDASYEQGWVFTKDFGDWETDSPWTWRLSSRFAPQGVIGDLGAHLFEAVLRLGGPVDGISAVGAVCPKQPARIGDLDLDSLDAFSASVRFSGGAVGCVRATRIAAGAVDRLAIRVSGDRGSLSIILPEDRYTLRRFDPAERVWTEVSCGRESREPSTYEHFLTALRGDGTAKPDFTAGLAVQSCQDACARAIREGGEVAVEPGVLLPEEK